MVDEKRSAKLIWSCDSNFTDEPDVFNEYLALCPVKLLYALVPALIMALTVAGNLFVIAAILTNARNRRKRTSILICNLAMADLLVGESIDKFFVGFGAVTANGNIIIVD